MAKTPRTEIITIRLTPKDRASIEKAAEREGMTVSEYIRAATLATMALRGNPHGLKMMAAGLGNLVDELVRPRSRTATASR